MSFLEIVFQVIIEAISSKILSYPFVLLFKGIYYSGVGIIKVLTFSQKSISELSQEFKNSSLPYFLGSGLFLIVGYLIHQLFLNYF